MIRVVAVDDHPLVLEFIQSKLQGEVDIELVGSEERGEGVLPLVRATRPDVVILDLNMDRGRFDPILTVQQLRREAPRVKVIVLTGEHSSVYMHALTRAGVRGYLLKSDDLSLELPRAIRVVHSGSYFLSAAVADELLSDALGTGAKLGAFTEQEHAILRLLAKGLSNGEIAAEVHLSGKRVGNLLTGIYQKLGVGDESNKRVAAVEVARARGLLPEHQTG
jgi:DNA-binding NarL/FixJ family response regulator